jgi:putative ABC transport system ATP-binding protein
VLALRELRVERGEKVFVKGPSGCGKTTMLNLIAGMAAPEQGQVTVLGQSLAALPQTRRDRFRAEHIGFVFQLFNLLPYLDVHGNVALGCRFARERRRRWQSAGGNGEIRRLLEALGLDADAFAGRAVSELSVGQQQRVAAARALLGSPDILIADEPTSALDADNRGSFLRLLGRECERSGTTLVFVSHDTALEAHFDRTLSLPDLNRAWSR